MIRRSFFLSACLTTFLASAAGNPPATAITEIVSPAAPGALGAALTTAPDGTVWMSWVEPGSAASSAAAGEHHHGAAMPSPEALPNALRFSTLDAAKKTWGPARTLIASRDVPTSSADFPQLALDAQGRAAAVWADGRGHGFVSTSADRGAIWSAPVPLTHESEDVEKFSLAVLADGRVLIAWLDGRAKKTGGKMTALYARVLGEPGPDVLVDPAVCDCCQTTLAPFLDGGALLAYRARTNAEVRDIRTARFRGTSWDTPRPLNNDDWRLSACPINGPRLAADGGRVSVAWFTAASSDPRVLASYSPDAGARFLMPLRIDRGHPTGHVETLLLRDGAVLVTWLEADGSYWMRRFSPDFTADDPIALAPAGSVAGKDFPRATLLQNYRGGGGDALFVAAFVSESRTEIRGALHTLLVAVPEGALLAAAKNCDCAPTPEQLTGYSMRGAIAAIAAEHGSVRVQHGEIPGIFAAGTHEFLVAPDVLAAAGPGRQFLGRIEQRNGAWWLYDVRLLVVQ